MALMATEDILADLVALRSFICQKPATYSCSMPPPAHHSTGGNGGYRPALAGHQAMLQATLQRIAEFEAGGVDPTGKDEGLTPRALRQKGNIRSVSWIWLDPPFAEKQICPPKLAVAMAACTNLRERFCGPDDQANYDDASALNPFMRFLPTDEERALIRQDIRREGRVKKEKERAAKREAAERRAGKDKGAEGGKGKEVMPTAADAEANSEAQPASKPKKRNKKQKQAAEAASEVTRTVLTKDLFLTGVARTMDELVGSNDNYIPGLNFLELMAKTMEAVEQHPGFRPWKDLTTEEFNAILESAKVNLNSIFLNAGTSRGNSEAVASNPQTVTVAGLDAKLTSLLTMARQLEMDEIVLQRTHTVYREVQLTRAAFLNTLQDGFLPTLGSNSELTPGDFAVRAKRCQYKLALSRSMAMKTAELYDLAAIVDLDGCVARREKLDESEAQAKWLSDTLKLKECLAAEQGLFIGFQAVGDMKLKRMEEELERLKGIKIKIQPDGTLTTEGLGSHSHY